MARSVIRTVLVIGDDHKEIIKKYSADTKVEWHLKCRRCDAEKYRQRHIKLIEGILESNVLKISERQREIYKNLYLDIQEMDDFEYFEEYTQGCRYDNETSDAYTDENPNAFYKYEKCHQEDYEKTGEEAAFSNPFILKDGTKSYVAKFNDIDWKKMHMNNTEVYESAWEIIMEGREPKNEIENTIYNSMSNRISYFKNFRSKEEYVEYSCSFWTYGVAMYGKYEEIDYHTRDIDWARGFFHDYIDNIGGNPTLAMYEVRSLND